MKKTKILTAILISLMLILAFCANMKVLATEGENEIQPRTAEGANGTVPINGEGDNNYPSYEEYDDDLYVASSETQYVMDKMVNGNVFIFGNNVKITGQISGSLFVCANSLEISETALVATHLFAAASDITINGAVYDVYSASERLALGENATIGRDIKSVAENINLAGTIGRNAKLDAANITVPAEAGKLTIYGDLDYSASQEIANKEAITINGEIKYNKITETEPDVGSVVLEYVFSAINTVVFDIVLYIALIFLAPKFVTKAKDYVSTKGVLAIVFGLAFLVLVPIAAILLLCIEVGVGLAGLLALIYLIAILISAFVVAFVANEFIAQKIKAIEDDKFKKGLLLIPVSLILWALRKLPFIGGIISAAVLLCGIGIVLMYQFDKMKKEEVKE